MILSYFRSPLQKARLMTGALLCLLPVAASAQTGYTIQGLSGFGTDIKHHVVSTGRGLNNKGVVVGGANVYDTMHNFKSGAAFLSLNGGLLNLGNFGNDPTGLANSYAYGLNNLSQIVGYSGVYDAMHNYKGDAPFLWNNGTLTNLGNFGTDGSGLGHSYAYAINDLSQIAGYSYAYDTNHNNKGTAAFLWNNGTLTNLGNFGTDPNGVGNSYAYGLNNLSQVVGFSYVYDAQHNSKGQAAFLWQSTVLTNLGNLGTDPNGLSYSYANAINNQTQVTGNSILYDGNHNSLGNRTFLWQNNTMTALPIINTSFANTSYAGGQAINDKGQIAGYSYRYDSNGNFLESDAVLWPNATTIVNLNDYLPPNSGWQLSIAYGINNRGQITGFGTHNGATEGFVLTPYTAGDFTRDGSPDILFQNSATGDLGLAAMSGVSRLYSLAPANAVPLAWKVVATPDLNGDGYADILWQNSQTGDIAYWLLTNGVITGHGTIYTGLPLNYKVVASADFNGDGSPDLVLQDTQTGNLYLWYLNGPVYYTYATLPSPGANWQVVGAGDFNGDGVPDLLLRNKTTGDLYTWLLTAQLTVTKGVFIGNVPLSWNMVGVGDYGGDGNASLLWQNANNDLYYWLMNGTTIASYGLIQSGVPNWQVVGPK